MIAQICRALHITPEAIQTHQWVDNGPGWCAIRLASAEAVLALQPDYTTLKGLKLGVVGAHAAGYEAQFEVRALIGEGFGYEDPVTGSLNASLAQWLIASGQSADHYVASQGAALRRYGRVHVEREDDTIWIGGDVAACVSGTVTL